jgi:hypothetical protein
MRLGIVGAAIPKVPTTQIVLIDLRNVNINENDSH